MGVSSNDEAEVTVAGRHADSRGKATALQATIRACADGRVLVRIDDGYHPDFWMEVYFTPDVLTRIDLFD